MVTIEQIEDAVINALEQKFKKGIAAGGYVRNIDSYGGEFESALETLVARSPFVLVEFERFENKVLAAKGTSALVYRRDMWFNIFAAAENLRGEKKARRGSTGTYAMVEDIGEALIGENLGLTIGGLDCERVYRIANLKRISVYQMVFKTFLKYRTQIT